MLPTILSLFPPHTHPLTLVSDPDGLLGGEAALVELAGRGFNLIQEDDAVMLRHRFEKARPVSAETPVLVIAAAPLAELPYDLWQPGYRIQLSIHQFFPNLAYPVVQTLTPAQLEQLANCPQPTEPTGRRRTIEYLLKQVFNVDAVSLDQPHRLIAWLARYHQSQSQCRCF